MADHDSDVVEVVKEGFKAMDAQVARAYGDTSARIHDLDLRIQKLEVEMKPVMREFNQRLPERVSLMEQNNSYVTARVKDLEEKVSNFNTKLWGALIAAVGGLVSVVWSIVEYVIRDKG